MRVDFRGNLLPVSRASVDLDLGETKLILPDDAGVKLSVSKLLFMSSVDLPYNYKKSGKYYYSKNFESASNQLLVKVSPGLGQLTVD